MSSDNSVKNRRTPQQSRAEARVAALLDAAAAEFSERGYDAATMTAIAARANASIGAVYQYFPNKAALGHALRVQYSKEMAQQWTAFASEASDMDIESMVTRMIELMVAFMDNHPAYLPLLSAALSPRRDQDERRLLRERFAALFQARAAHLTSSDALRIANVAIQIVKSMNPLYADAGASERQKLVQEFRLAVTAYLRMRLHPDAV